MITAISDQSACYFLDQYISLHKCHKYPEPKLSLYCDLRQRQASNHNIWEGETTPCSISLMNELTIVSDALSVFRF